VRESPGNTSVISAGISFPGCRSSGLRSQDFLCHVPGVRLQKWRSGGCAQGIRDSSMVLPCGLLCSSRPLCKRIITSFWLLKFKCYRPQLCSSLAEPVLWSLLTAATASQEDLSVCRTIETSAYSLLRTWSLFQNPYPTELWLRRWTRQEMTGHNDIVRRTPNCHVQDNLCHRAREEEIRLSAVKNATLEFLLCREYFNLCHSIDSDSHLTTFIMEM